MDGKGLMSLAIEKTREGIAAGQSPFGSIIVKDGKVVASTHNTVWKDTDPTAHAEVNCIRSAAKALGTIDLSVAHSIRRVSLARCAWRRSTGQRSTALSSAPRSVTPTPQASASFTSPRPIWHGWAVARS